jgi:hypothetical protein
MRNVCLVLPLLALSAAQVSAQDPLPWQPVEGKPNVKLHPAGKLQPGPVLEVTGGDDRTTTTLLELKDPKLPSHRYMLTGRIKYDGVAGQGYIEMLNTFPNRGTFFTRTLAQGGPMGELTGSSDWRDLELPFMSEPGLLPEKIVVNVVLPGKGTVYLAPLKMGELAGQEEGQMAGAWWGERQAGLVGGVLGACIGIAGGVIGLGAGLGRGRRGVLLLCWTLIAVGVASLAAGLAALSLRQPYHVYYPLLLIGIITPLVIGFNLGNIRRRYDERELRKMTALDA